MISVAWPAAVLSLGWMSLPKAGFNAVEISLYLPSPVAGLNIYGCETVKPYKLTLAAEGLNIRYNYINLDMAKHEQGSECAACLPYIADEFDNEHKLSYPSGIPEYWSQLSWLSWQVVEYGPMMMQAIYFNRFATDSVPYAAKRYSPECRRLHHVLDKQLSISPSVAGDRMTIADLFVFVYVHSTKRAGIDTAECPNVRAWYGRLVQRSAFQRGLNTPVPFPFSDEAVSDPTRHQIYVRIRKYGGQKIKEAADRWDGQVLSVPSDHANLDNQ
ncbi:glutathione S-transferase [Xylariaceae sp. FL1272]|nr:glutathione S-transferase [Xylariaceae sp. FL1272]